MAARRTDNPAVIATRGRMIGMWEAGMPLPAIAHELGVSRQTVWRWVQRWQEEGVLMTKPKSGRPKVTNRQEEQQIITTARKRPMLSSYQITHHHQLPHHPRTTRRRLHEGGIHCFVPAVKETLSPANKEARLEFALQYLPMEPEFWETTIFTDEKVFTSVESPARQCWRPKNTRYQPENICNIKRSGRKSTSFWGWMWGYGPGELVKIEGRFNGQQYIEVLEELLLPSVRAMAIPHPLPIKFVHDNSSIHRSKVVQQWLNEHPELEVFDWPTKGCDINPIENLWAIMCREWDVGDDRTEAGIERKAREVWESVRRRPNVCSNLVKSIPSRLEEVISAFGGWSSY
ncbi:hypothetical protein Pmani_000754 [Petrolisthes manimaculis]|uniref:Transposase n=1 Tax=Petrolisthes manimaculis TaxID=1843537 RepID=A0AAE1USP3_9EUCA|nr:hypothetical protein Pmani_000754 [Petrolisthes manimaculis]